MTVPTPLAVGDELLMRKADGSDRSERVIARYLPVRNADGTLTNQWLMARNLPRALARAAIDSGGVAPDVAVPAQNSSW